jgi:predicted permease
MIAIVVILGAMFVPTTMVIAVGLLPSAAAFIVDQDAKRSITMTVTLMNSVGVLPFVLDLWKKGQTIDHSLAIIEEPVTWLIMYGAAGVGWVICFTVPHIVQLILGQRARLQIADLERQQEDLRHEWGEEVKQKPAFPAQPPT